MLNVETTAQNERLLPSEINRRLRHYRRLCCNVKLVNGLAKLASALLLLLIGAVVLFHLEVLGFGARMYVIGGWVLATTVAVWFFIELHLASREQFINDQTDDVSIAASMERDNPALNESLLSTVEIFRSTDSEEITGSPQLVDALAAQTSEQLKAMRIKARVTFRHAAMFVMLALGLGWMLLFVGMPKGMGLVDDIRVATRNIVNFAPIHDGPKEGDGDVDLPPREDKEPPPPDNEPPPPDEPRKIVDKWIPPTGNPPSPTGINPGDGEGEGVWGDEAARKQSYPWTPLLQEDVPTANPQQPSRDAVSPEYEAVTREYFKAISEGRLRRQK